MPEDPQPTPTPPPGNTEYYSKAYQLGYLAGYEYGQKQLYSSPDGGNYLKDPDEIKGRHTRAFDSGFDEGRRDGWEDGRFAAKGKSPP